MRISIKKKVYRHYFLSSILFLLIQASYGKEHKNAMHPAPIVNFEISHFCLGDSIYFTNTSLLGNTYEWDIYVQVDGGHGTTADSLIYTSTNFNINYLFPDTGYYHVVLTGFNGHTVSIDRYFTMDSLIHANFDYTYCGSKFMNTSVCYTNCLWDFGDGHSSTADSPIHFYDTIGTYTIKLITYNTANSSTDTLIDNIYVSSTKNLNGDFRYIVNKDSVLFLANDSVSGPFSQYHWSFGDGAVIDLSALAGGRKVNHTYLRKDTTYTVFLLAKTSCLNGFSQQSIFVPDSTPVYSTYIYPNPVIDLLHIATERKADLIKIQIIDCLGKSIDNVLLETIKGFNLDISCLANGMYYVQLHFSDGIITKKILKQ